ncbi:MAG: hypothetical protein DRO87_02075 [Candidatus Thorarchaeota archaeon]|nr:MAG: hypothetical protein DRP09_04500 [Candidatus Thorarchaeota archaeon]RLI59748.1 MAG: hypothetical protein DRO87_02075 [Candidatus Thorarchaeota archaeon]
MRFVDGLKLLLTKPWYNTSFLLSLVATLLASTWILIYPTPPTTITDPLWGIGISIVVSFQYFMIALVLFSLTSQGRTYFFEGENQTRNQLLLSALFIIIFMALGGISALAGPFIGAALAFGDALITAYFTILLGWNVSRYVSMRVQSKKPLQWILFITILLVAVLCFGAAYLFLNLGLLPLSQQIVLLVFPLVIILLPVMTVVLRSRASGLNQTPLLGIVIFGFGLYYTYRLLNISDQQWALFDILTQTIILLYGLATTVAKFHDTMDLKPGTTVTLVLLVILSRVGSQVNRLLAASVGLGDIVNLGTTSFTLVMLSILGLLVPVYWMWRGERRLSEE